MNLFKSLSVYNYYKTTGSQKLELECFLSKNRCNNWVVRQQKFTTIPGGVQDKTDVLVGKDIFNFFWQAIKGNKSTQSKLNYQYVFIRISSSDWSNPFRHGSIINNKPTVIAF